MKTIIVNELESLKFSNIYVLNLKELNIKDCVGCWTCWWKTPGICIFKDLNEFYHQYVTADKVIFFCSVKNDFVSGEIKNLFDRMIPLFMPYTYIETGESMHVMRYDKYPDIEFYYDGEFVSETGRKVYEDYVNRVFYQFFSKNISVKHISEYQKKEKLLYENNHS